MRLVVDTNVLVSGLLTPFGPPGVIVGLIAGGRLGLCYDARMLAEYDAVLHRPSFPFGEEDVALFLAQIRANGELVPPVPLSIRLRHPDDEPFLEVANAAMVDFLVTGNLRHFPERSWKGVRIVSPRQFLDQFDDSREALNKSFPSAAQGCAAKFGGVSHRICEQNKTALLFCF